MTENKTVLAVMAHPDDAEFLCAGTLARGQEIGVPAAEAFVQHRGHAYPQEDLLLKLM